MSELTESTIVKELKAAADQLPDSAEEIRSFLASEGIMGIPEEGYDCPLARFFTKKVPGCYISVDGSYVEVEDSDFRTVTGVELDKKSLNTFVRKFDRGQYPELIDQGEEV